ncbi:MAG TPA: TIGR02206 family membrane protein [Terriglobales bacterium]|nr:TIGR02206 family membrane protein [Terriglobales bacterium]
MRSNFRLFGPAHLLILTSAPILGLVLAKWCRKSRTAERWIRCLIALFLSVNELVWYAYRLHYEGFRFPRALPLNLCDLTLWLTVGAILSLNQWAFELAYFAGLGGSGMALITPDLWAPFPSYPTVYFFLAHGVVVAAILMLVWSKIAEPKPGCLRRALVLLNVYAVVIGIFNAIFGTNYMYLCSKPAGTSLLDYLGPWLLYIVGGEVVALVIFWLLWLPFRIGARASSQAAARG